MKDMLSSIKDIPTHDVAVTWLTLNVCISQRCTLEEITYFADTLALELLRRDLDKTTNPQG